jgi:hypothetical protein
MPKVQAASPNPIRRATTPRRSVTLEVVVNLCPHESLASNLSTTFGLEPVDFAAIREATEEHVVRSANALVDNLNEKAMQIHLQRIVGAFVGSAHGAGQFYGQKVTQARDLTAKLNNEDRDEDRSGEAGLESRADALASAPQRWGYKPMPFWPPPRVRCPPMPTSPARTGSPMRRRRQSRRPPNARRPRLRWPSSDSEPCSGDLRVPATSRQFIVHTNRRTGEALGSPPH